MGILDKIKEFVPKINLMNEPEYQRAMQDSTKNPKGSGVVRNVRDFKRGVVAQVNPFDGGATFNNRHPEIEKRRLEADKARAWRQSLPIYTSPPPMQENPNIVANWQMNQSPEDASYMMGQQGPVPINADIANFQIQPQGMPEDAGLVRGPQGYAPLNNDVGHLRRAQSYIRQLYR